MRNKLDAKFGQAYQDARDLYVMKLETKAVRWETAHLKTLAHQQKNTHKNMTRLMHASNFATIHMLDMSDSFNRVVNALHKLARVFRKTT